MEIQRKGVEDIGDAEKQEEQLKASAACKYQMDLAEFRLQYLQKRLSSEIDDSVRDTVLDFVIDKHQLSRIHSQFGAVIATEADRLMTLVPKAINAWKNALLNQHRHELNRLLEHASPEKEREILIELQKLDLLRGKLAQVTGEQVINSL